MAHDWDKTPSEWFALSDEDKALMMAYTQTEGQMAAWDIEQGKKKR